MKAQRTAVAYIRVSSRSQDTATQRTDIARCAAARGDRIATWYEETRSARTLERPVFQKMRQAIAGGGISRVYLYRLDRLARSGIRDTLAIVYEFRTCGCHIVTCADGFLIDGPASDVVLAVIAWAAQMERLAIGERIAAARKHVEARGGHWGRPRRVTDALVGRIQMLRDEGQSTRQIAQSLKVPKTTVGAVLSGKGPYAHTKKLAAKKRRARPTA